MIPTYALIIVLWTVPGGYTVTGQQGLTLDQCEERAWAAKGQAVCVVDG
jgi:hypothetical protein